MRQVRTLVEKCCIENASFLDSFVTQRAINKERLKEYNYLCFKISRNLLPADLPVVTRPATLKNALQFRKFLFYVRP